MAQFARYPSSSVTVGSVGQGSPNTTANAWPVKLTDGTNVTAVKPSTTAAVAGDPAAVVALSPNSPVPAGTNLVGKFGIDQTTPGTTNGVQVNAALPAGTNLLGKVGIDQTTPGTTNGVQVNAALPAGTNKIGALTTVDTVTAVTTVSTVTAVTTVAAVTAITNALPAGTNLLGKVGIDQTTPGATNGVQVNAALPAGTNLLGKFGIDQTTPGTTNGVQVNAALPAGTNTIGFTKQAGSASVVTVYNSYASTSVTTSAYVQLVASTASAINKIYISDTSGSGFYIATGAGGSEVNQVLFGPGGMDGAYSLAIAAGTRISIKAVDTTATTGALYMTCLA